MNCLRFIAVIKSPGAYFSEHEVIDLVRKVVICTCSMSSDADRIAAALNKLSPEVLEHPLLENVNE